MTPDQAIEIGKNAIMMVALLSAPGMLGALIIGVVVGMFQAATQINESTLSFVPKLFILGFMLIATAPWMLGVIIDYTKNTFIQIPSLIG
jgi:flagellar biosynthetic protein FliQ